VQSLPHSIDLAPIGVVLVWVVLSCAGARDRATPATPEPSADPSSRVTMQSAAKPNRGTPAPEPGKGDAPSLVQPVNDCDIAVCAGNASDALIDAIRSRASQARGCYEAALKQTPTSAGRLMLNLRIAYDGTSCPLRAAQNELPEATTLLPCLRSLLEIQYPKPRNGCVELNLPLKFVPEYIEADAGTTQAAGKR
jgi:hypothetical protein